MEVRQISCVASSVAENPNSVTAVGYMLGCTRLMLWPLIPHIQRHPVRILQGPQILNGTLRARTGKTAFIVDQKGYLLPGTLWRSGPVGRGDTYCTTR
jgi:hypothetical protein